MMDLTLLIAPIFLVILLGLLLKRLLIKNEDVWHQINKLTYWVLFPALLFNKTAVIDFAEYSVLDYSASMMLGYVTAALFAYVMCKIYAMSPEPLSSVIQGSGRHNSFMALAVMGQVLGEQGEIYGALAIAVMVTFSNIITIIYMTAILSQKRSSYSVLISEIVRNPFIVAIAFGLTFNYLGWGGLPVLFEFTESIGAAALPIALICVGSGLRFVGIGKYLYPTVIACTAKMIILPIVVYGAARYLELSPVMTTSAVIFATVPTSSTSYALAKYMGGDAPLMAAIISVQMMLAVIAMPLAIMLVS